MEPHSGNRRPVWTASSAKNRPEMGLERAGRIIHHLQWQHRERALTETDEQLVELRTFLNTGPRSTSKNETKGKEGAVEAQTDTPGKQKQDDAKPESEESAASKPKKDRRPGERLPKRDPIGRRKNAS